jgi:hypothetical protein
VNFVLFSFFFFKIYMVRAMIDELGFLFAKRLIATWALQMNTTPLANSSPPPPPSPYCN